MMGVENNHMMDGGEIVHVPVPQHLLPAVYRALAAGLATTATNKRVPAVRPAKAVRRQKKNRIDLITDIALELEADRWPVSVTDLYEAYMKAYSERGKGTTRESFNATVGFYCINMRSRFPYKDDKLRSASWLTRPTFKRVGWGQYMLLSDEEIAKFRRCIEEDNPLVYADEYDIDDLNEQAWDDIAEGD